MSWSAGSGRGGTVCPPAGFPPDPCRTVGAVINRPGDSAGVPAGQCAPHSLFGCAKKRTRRARCKRKRRRARSGAVALRAYGGRRTSACSDLALPSGTLCSSAIPVAAVPWRMAPTSSGWLSHGAASLFATAHAPAKNPAARSAAERAEREADQMRPCTPLTFAPAPRESAFKPVPHPAAPVGRSSQTRMFSSLWL